MGNERWQSRTNCEMANAAQTDIKYAGWTQDCWPKTELKTNFLVPQQQLKLTDGPGEEDAIPILGVWNRSGYRTVEQLWHFMFLFAIFFFSFLSCEQLAIIGTLSAPNWWSFDKGNSPLSPFCSLTGSFCRAKMQHEMQSLWLMKFSKLHLLAFIDGFSMTNATWQQTLSQQVNRINVGQMQVVIRLVCCQIGIRILQDFKIVTCYRLNLGIFKSFGFTYWNVKINLHWILLWIMNKS